MAAKRGRMVVMSDRSTPNQYASAVLALRLEVLHEGVVGNEALAQAALAICQDALVRSGLIAGVADGEARGERPQWAGYSDRESA